jgi:hypothetical protein
LTVKAQDHAASSVGDRGSIILASDCQKQIIEEEGNLMNDILLFMPCLGKCGGGGAWAKAMWTKDLCKLNCLRVVQRTKNLMSH